jgi:hypothetical protein
MSAFWWSPSANHLGPRPRPKHVLAPAANHPSETTETATAITISGAVRLGHAVQRSHIGIHEALRQHQTPLVGNMPKALTYLAGSVTAAVHILVSSGVFFNDEDSERSVRARALYARGAASSGGTPSRWVRVQHSRNADTCRPHRRNRLEVSARAHPFGCGKRPRRPQCVGHRNAQSAGAQTRRRAERYVIMLAVAVTLSVLETIRERHRALRHFEAGSDDA